MFKVRAMLVCVCVFLRRASLVVLILRNLIQEQWLRNPDLTVFNWFNLRAENEMNAERP